MSPTCKVLSCRKFIFICYKNGKNRYQEKAKSISTFVFTSLYKTIPHKFVMYVLSEVINFVLKSKTRSRIVFSETSNYWTSKGCGRRYFARQTLFHAISFLVRKCNFTIGNVVFKEEISIPMGINPTPYWADVFQYFFESRDVQQFISEMSSCAYRFHGTSRFIGNLCTILQLELHLNRKENMQHSWIWS